MKKTHLLLIAIILFQLFFLVNLRFTAWPEMTSFAYFKNNGFLLYKDMLHAYPPLLTIVLSIVYSLFGYKIIVLKLFTWFIITLNAFLIFLVIKDTLKSERAALAGVVFYALIQPFLEGNGMWFELGMTPLLLLGFLFFNRAIDKKKITLFFISGFCFGLALLVKQIAGVFLILTATILFLRKEKFKNIFTFGLGVLITILILFIRLHQEDQVAGFIYWVFTYPSEVWINFPGNVQPISNPESFMALGLISLPIIYALFEKNKLIKNKHFLVGLSFYLISFSLMYPTFSFFRLQPTIAFLAIVVGFAFEKVKPKKEHLIVYFSFLAFLIISPSINADWRKETRFYEKDKLLLASKLSEIISQRKPIYVQGLHSGYYSLLDNIPAKPWVDNFPWNIGAPGVAEWVISGWEKNSPAFIIAAEPSKSEEVNEWIDKNYTLSKEIGDNIVVWEKNK